MRVLLWFGGLALGALLSGAPAAALTSADIEDDAAGRVIAPVMLNGQGPFRLVLDTGAGAIVLTPETAAAIGAAADGSAPVSGVGGQTRAPRVRIAALDAGAFTRADAPAVVLSGHMLGGADGMIGADSFAGQRMAIDLEARRMTLEPGGAPAPAGFETASGVLRPGGLLIVDALIDGVRAKALIDTGAEATLVNRALGRGLRTVRAQEFGYGVSGAEAATPSAIDTVVEVALIRSLALGEIRTDGVRAYLADLPMFVVGGVEQPGAVIGMDVWRRADILAIDYVRAEVQVRDQEG